MDNIANVDIYIEYMDIQQKDRTFQDTGEYSFSMGLEFPGGAAVPRDLLIIKPRHSQLTFFCLLLVGNYSSRHIGNSAISAKC